MRAVLLHGAELPVPAGLLRAPWQLVQVERIGDGGLGRLAEAGVSLVVSFTCAPEEALQAGQQAFRLGLPHLPIRLEQGGARALLGPLERPGEPGCLGCLRLRQEEAGTAPGNERPLVHRVYMGPSGWNHALCCLAWRLSGEPSPVVYELKRQSLSVRRRVLLPSGRCLRCAGRRAAEQGRQVSISTSGSTSGLEPPEDLDRYEGETGFVRQRPLGQWDGLEQLVEERLGPVLNLRREMGAQHVLPTVSAQAAVADVGGRTYGIGRALGFATAGRIGVLEAIERTCGLRDGTGRPRVRAPFEALGDRALDPRRAGLYLREQYERPGFPCRPFEPQETMEWCWGWSLNRRQALLVPADLVFYGSQEGTPLVAETSNGCSIGSSPEEALLFGLLEQLERDAAMRLWYRQQPVPRLSWEPGGTRLAALLRERLGQLGYEVHAFDATTELAMPVTVLVALRTSGHGAATLCASGAHPHMAVAVERALSELASMAAWGSQLLAEEWTRAEALEEAPDRVRDIGDHLLALAFAPARSRLGFLLDGPTPMRSLVGYESPDPTLAGLVQRLGRAGMELLAVSQTPPELRRQGLFCVRAIVPGLIPMHYGATLRREVLAGRGGEAWAETLPHPFS